MNNVFRVSEVESYRQWKLDEEAELSDLIERLSGGFEPTPAMLAGTAFHKALETAQDGEIGTLEADGYRFEVPVDIELSISGIREIRSNATWQVDGKPITISGQLDTINGKRIEDHKTTARYDPERFITGYQWRLYLSIFSCDCFRWNVFEIKEGAYPLDWTVTAFHQLEQFRYPTMEADCFELVSEFARFVREYMPERCK